MKSISTFYTIFWILYFPTCIAYNNLKGFSSIDEAMTIILIAFTFWKKRSVHEPKVWKEFYIFLGILTIYTLYSLLFGANIAHAVYLDFFQWIRPFSIIYCTWLLKPKFSRQQKWLMLSTMIITLFSWIAYHPQTLDAEVHAEFPVLGQLAICTGMAYYLFTKETITNKWIALALVFTGMLAPKFKFMGEVVCFIGLIFFLKKKLNFASPRTLAYVGILMVVVLTICWTRFDVYYVSGLNNASLARPMTYKTSLLVLRDYFPFGPGMGTFATNAAGVDYSPLFYKYHLNEIWGLGEIAAKAGFAGDAFYPALAQFGIVGVTLFFWFWERRFKQIDAITDIKYYRVALMALFCLIIEQTADSSILSGKGMGYCMLIGLCINANKSQGQSIIKTTIYFNHQPKDVNLLNQA